MKMKELQKGAFRLVRLAQFNILAYRAENAAIQAKDAELKAIVAAHSYLLICRELDSRCELMGLHPDIIFNLKDLVKSPGEIRVEDRALAQTKALRWHEKQMDDLENGRISDAELERAKWMNKCLVMLAREKK